MPNSSNGNSFNTLKKSVYRNLKSYIFGVNYDLNN